jgi:hypothetical protein
MSRLAKNLYIASALRDRLRAIDRYIDYFGDRTSSPPRRRPASRFAKSLGSLRPRP